MFEKEEKNSKRLSVDRIADLLRFQFPLNEKTKELIEKIIEDTWCQAEILEKMKGSAK